MEVFATWTWIFQALFLGLGSLVAFFAPQFVTREVTDVTNVPIAMAFARMLVPVQGSLALLSAYAAMRQATDTRRALARTFSFVFVIWLVSRAAEIRIATSSPASFDSVLTASLDAALAFLAAVNLAYSFHVPGKSFFLGTLVAQRRVAIGVVLIAFVYVALRATSHLDDVLRVFHAEGLPTTLGGLCGRLLDALRAHGILVAIASFFVVSMVFALRRQERASLAAVINTMPPQLWVLWVLQFVVLFAIGTGMFVRPEETLHLLLARTPEIGNQEARVSVMTHAGAIYLGMAIATRIGIAETSTHEWQVFARIHVFGFTLQLVAGLLAWQPGIFDVPVALLAVLVIAYFGVQNYKVVASTSQASAEEVGQGPDGWTLMDLATGPALTIQSLRSRRRGTHLFGVGAEGTFTVIPSQFDRAPHNGYVRKAARRPSHAFFVPGNTFAMKARFSTVTYQDDASCDVRGAAIRVHYSHDGAGHRTFDMLMNTGAMSAVDDLKSFGELIIAKFIPEGIKEKIVQNTRAGIEAGVSGFRQSPTSYGNLHFYSQNVRHWIDPDDVRWLVRYRLMPFVDGPMRDGEPTRRIRFTDAGVPDEKRRMEIWKRGRSPSDERPKDYLRREMKQRVEAGAARFVFQAQFHLPEAGDTLDWYNAGVDWPILSHPWHDIAVVALKRPLPDDETERLRFNSANHPASLGVPIATGWKDFRSMADSERRILSRLQGLRTWLYDNLGMPGDGN